MQQSNVVPITSARSVTPPTRKISAREAATDIKSGMSDFILMEKYTLSTKGLQSLFQKLVDARLVSKSELSNRISLGEDSVALDIIKCPSCGMPQFGSFDECPQCGVIVSKYQQKLLNSSCVKTERFRCSSGGFHSFGSGISFKGVNV